jgi:hypothetical protein
MKGSRWEMALQRDHLTLFTFEGLNVLLERAGFVEARRLSGRVQFSRNPLRARLHDSLRWFGLDGQLRVIARRPDDAP